MADHGHVEYATAKGNDLPVHEAMYERFIHLVVVGGALVVNIVLGLAIGGVAGHWALAFAIILVATVVGIFGMATGGKTPSAAMVLISLVVLALTAGGGHPT
jgi:hypothetical protein